MDSVGFKSEMIFILILFLFFKNYNCDSTVLGGAQPYVIVHHYLFIFILWDMFHCVRNNVASKDLLLFCRKIFPDDQDMSVLVQHFSYCQVEHTSC